MQSPSRLRDNAFCFDNLPQQTKTKHLSITFHSLKQSHAHPKPDN